MCLCGRQRKCVSVFIVTADKEPGLVSWESPSVKRLSSKRKARGNSGDGDKDKAHAKKKKSFEGVMEDESEAQYFYFTQSHCQEQQS